MHQENGLQRAKNCCPRIIPSRANQHNKIANKEHRVMEGNF